MELEKNYRGMVIALIVKKLLSPVRVSDFIYEQNRNIVDII